MMKAAVQKELQNNIISPKRKTGNMVLRPSTFSALPLAAGQSYMKHDPSCPCNGGCPRCTTNIQTKLKVGAPNDKYEQEADRVADQVMRAPSPYIQKKPT